MEGGLKQLRFMGYEIVLHGYPPPHVVKQFETFMELLAYRSPLMPQRVVQDVKRERDVRRGGPRSE